MPQAGGALQEVRTVERMPPMDYGGCSSRRGLAARSGCYAILFRVAGDVVRVERGHTADARRPPGAPAFGRAGWSVNQGQARSGCWSPCAIMRLARRALPAEGQGFRECAARGGAPEGVGQRGASRGTCRCTWRRASGPWIPRGRRGICQRLGHANIATTRIYDHRKMRPEDRPTFKVAY